MSCDCPNIVRLLADFIEGQLPREQHEALERHLAQCPRCVTQVKTYRSTVSMLRSISDEELPAELRCTLKAFLSKRCQN